MTDHVDAPSTRPEFVIPVRPAGVPPGLCELRPDIHVVGIEPHGAHYTTAGKLANHIQGTIERQAAGRFYLWEAAQILADSHGKSLEGIRDAMRRAVSLGALCVRVVGSDEPMSAGSRLRIDGMDSYVTPEGLNEWLEADRYPYRFPVAAAPSASPAARPDAVAVPAAPEAPDIASAPAVVHRVGNRAHSLDGVIAEARRRAVRDDWLTVWGELIRMAECSDRPAPLMGYAPGDELKVQSDAPEGFTDYTKDAFRQLWRRRNKG